MSYVNLHCHSHYSLLDGFGSPKSIVKRCKELGCPAVALTDHGVSYGLIELYKECKAQGIKPILGCEFYIANRTRFDKEAKVDVKPYHLTVIAKNNTGYKNLLKLVTIAHLEGFYYKPRIDYDVLKQYSEGLIAMSGCVSAHIPRAILSQNEAEIDRLINLYIDIFGKEDFYLELQDHPLYDNQQTVNTKLIELSKKYVLELIASCDSHYACPGDNDVHDIMLCIQTGKTLNDEGRMRYTGDFSIRTPEDLKNAFKDNPEAVSNTLKVAEKCNVDFEFGINLIPSYETPEGMNAEEFLRQECFDGLKRRFKKKEIPKNYLDRLNFELDTVHTMGFDTYFLIVSDFVRYAKKKKIVVGPGRGSAAGSIISWCLDITNVDPIYYGLFFERFLNPERVSMPDIDIDFADHRRDEVISYVIEKYGRENVAQIITFGTMAPKASIRDTGRALGYPYQEVDLLAKSVPPSVLGKYAPLVESIVDDPTLSSIYKNDSRARKLLDYAKRLEGSVRHIGTHACAVVISEKPLTNYTAMQFAARGTEEIVTQYSAKPLEDLGLLKMDFLGLKNLTVIENTIKIVKRMQDKLIDIDDIPFDDKKTFELFQKAATTGVFQFESPGIKRYLKQLKASKFDDIVAMGALYRPGPMDWIPNYISGKHNPKKVKYLDESFKGILANTYGVAVFQEQILQLARDFAGFSLGEADILRKAVGKKILSLLEQQRDKFVKGAVANGHKEKFAKEVFEKVIEPFAGYGFNKAHAVCYGVIAYQTAYLKAHFPVEFMTALLCSDATNTDRVVLDIKECIEMGIDVLAPNLNESFTNFTVLDKKKIRFGLLAIKGIGEGPVKIIIEERKLNGVFKSLEDFSERIPSNVLNKKLIQALAYTGALDDFGNRNQIAENYELLSSHSKFHHKNASNGQTDIFGLLDDDSVVAKFNFSVSPKSTEMQHLKWEKELLGMYVSGHPLKGLQSYIASKSVAISSLDKTKIDKKVKVIGLISDFRRLTTKKGDSMATFCLEDTTARVNAIIFPRIFQKYQNQLTEDAVVRIEGKFDFKRDQYQISCDSVKILSIRAMKEGAKESNRFDENDKSAIAVRSLSDIIAENENDFESDSVVTPLFLISISKDVKPELMSDLKKLLISNKGETLVDIFLEGSNKKIRLPFGIKLDNN